MHILFCNWRDTRNPEGGGSEQYVERMARGLVDRGHRVTIACAAHPNAPADEVVDGVRFVRRGSKLDIYLRIFGRLLLRRYGSVDVVVDVQNGLPFFTRWATRRPVVVLVHHVHREQWPVVYPGMIGRVGWWIERRLAPFMYRRSRYVTVSDASRRELVALGVDDERIRVIHNGSDLPPVVRDRRADEPRLVVLGRLVPHKQVEHAIDALAAVRAVHPGAELDVVGDGWWHDELVAHAEQAGVAGAVHFHGFVDERRKHELLARAWLMLLPSLKEGWGIVIGEAALHATPTVAYASAGGTTESIEDGVSGVLAAGHDDLVTEVVALIGDDPRRAALGAGARERAAVFSWSASQEAFARLLERERRGAPPAGGATSSGSAGGEEQP